MAGQNFSSPASREEGPVTDRPGCGGLAELYRQMRPNRRSNLPALFALKGHSHAFRLAPMKCRLRPYRVLLSSELASTWLCGMVCHELDTFATSNSEELVSNRHCRGRTSRYSALNNIPGLLRRLPEPLAMDLVFPTITSEMVAVSQGSTCSPALFPLLLVQPYIPGPWAGNPVCRALRIALCCTAALRRFPYPVRL